MSTSADLAIAGAPSSWIDDTQPGRTMVVAVVDDVPIWPGITIGRARGSGPTATLSLVTPEAYLDRRYASNHTWTGVDECTVVGAGLIGDCAVHGISLTIDAVASGTLISPVYADSDDTTILSALTSLMQTGSPEFTIAVAWSDSTKTGFTLTARIRHRLGIISDAPTAVFELPGAVTSYTQQENYQAGSGATLARTYGNGEGASRASSGDVAGPLIAQGWPRWDYRWTPNQTTTDTAVLLAAASKAPRTWATGSAPGPWTPTRPSPPGPASTSAWATASLCSSTPAPARATPTASTSCCAPWAGSWTPPPTRSHPCWPEAPDARCEPGRRRPPRPGRPGQPDPGPARPPDQGTASSKRLEAATIGAGGLTVTGKGGQFVVDDFGNILFVIGGLSVPLLSGDPQYGVIANRQNADGTAGAAALTMYNATGDMPQTLGLYDAAGNALWTDDAAAGQGIGRPYISFPMAPMPSALWPSTTAGAWTNLLVGAPPKQQPTLYMAGFASTPTGVTGQLRLFEATSGTQVGATVTIASQPAGTNWSIGPAAAPGNHLDTLQLELQGQITGGAGAIAATVYAAFGRQS